MAAWRWGLISHCLPHLNMVQPQYVTEGKGGPVLAAAVIAVAVR